MSTSLGCMRPSSTKPPALGKRPRLEPAGTNTMSGAAWKASLRLLRSSERSYSRSGRERMTMSVGSRSPNSYSSAVIRRDSSAPSSLRAWRSPFQEMRSSSASSTTPVKPMFSALSASITPSRSSAGRPTVAVMVVRYSSGLTSAFHQAAERDSMSLQVYRHTWGTTFLSPSSRAFTNAMRLGMLAANVRKWPVSKIHTRCSVAASNAPLLPVMAMRVTPAYEAKRLRYLTVVGSAMKRSDGSTSPVAATSSASSTASFAFSVASLPREVSSVLSSGACMFVSASAVDASVSWFPALAPCSLAIICWQRAYCASSLSKTELSVWSSFARSVVSFATCPRSAVISPSAAASAAVAIVRSRCRFSISLSSSSIVAASSM
ncbi:hypothetical protein CAOG_009965 [Capsaspora owczarzaki ATCC 30864]|uniref:Uncharacterized protein n=1 Tax=Capsaspora owczarzaki (strain ATCC 30864) TaxID=595528 RepID=A0A0D2X4B5_CAPO3|nr:hypothetical protein CAOG_009965 [Capsaspora owczarzaki ATCC 30864]